MLVRDLSILMPVTSWKQQLRKSTVLQLHEKTLEEGVVVVVVVVEEEEMDGGGASREDQEGKKGGLSFFADVEKIVGVTVRKELRIFVGNVSGKRATNKIQFCTNYLLARLVINCE